MTGTTSPLQHLVEEAAEPISQFWPMKGYVSHNPLQGFEHLPFDEAFQQAKGLFGAEGYLPVEKYRSLFEAARIKAESVDCALDRVGPKSDKTIALASRTISAKEVNRLHLIHGIDALEPALFDWHLSSEGVLEKPQPGVGEVFDLNKLWQQVLSTLNLTSHSAYSQQQAEANIGEEKLELPFRCTLSDWLDQLTKSSIVTTIDQQLIKWTSSFVDEGMAGWSMPGRRPGFYAAWRELAQHDMSGRFLGISDFAKKIADLPADPETAIQQSLTVLQIPEARWPDYITRMLAQLPGWTGLIRWRGLNQDDPIQQTAPIDVLQYLAVRLFYERELVALQARRKWGVEGNLAEVANYLKDHGKAPEAIVSAHKLALSRDAWRLFHLSQLLGFDADSLREITSEQASSMLGWLDDFPVEKQLPVWLEAYEDSFRTDLLSNIKAHQGTVPALKERPLAQAAFCIDVRSEPFRRHLEAAGAIETFGYAGFFGIPISHRSYDAEESFPLCPVLLSPANVLYELPRAGQQEALSKYASGSRWMQLGEKLFHDMKHSPIASFLLVKNF